MPLNDFGPATFPEQNLNSQKLQDITRGVKPKKKFSSKYRKYPKKYQSGLKKQKLKLKNNPVSEFVEDFSDDSLKNKRKIPFSSNPSAFSAPHLEPIIVADKVRTEHKNVQIMSFSSIF